MTNSILGACAIFAIALATMAPPQDIRQDTQQNSKNKSDYNKQKKRNKDRMNNDTMSNRRMHDRMPGGVDTPPDGRRSRPIPDTTNMNMH